MQVRQPTPEGAVVRTGDAACLQCQQAKVPRKCAVPIPEKGRALKTCWACKSAHQRCSLTYEDAPKMGTQPPSTQVEATQPPPTQAMATQAKATQEPLVRKSQRRAEKTAAGGANSVRLPASSASNPSDGPRASSSKVLESTLR